MAIDKYFLFRRERVNQYSEIFSNTGEGLSVLAVSADKVSYITAKQGTVVMLFNNAGLYDSDGGTDREALAKTKVEIACEVGEEYELVEELIKFITSPNTAQRVLRFDAVTGTGNFKRSATDGKASINTLVPKQPLVMSTLQLSNDPASIDLTQTTTTTLDEITFTSPSLMPIIDYNSVAISGYSIGAEVGQTNHWHNAGTGGATYDMDDNTNAPVMNRSETNGLRENAVAVDADPENLILANSLTVEDDYTMYMVIGAVAYSSFGHNIVDGTVGTHIGFASASGKENTNSEFWVRHETSSLYSPAYMRLDNTDNGTEYYRYPDEKLEAGITGDKVGQTCYVFLLRRDKDYNLYLHNHTGDIVGYVPANMGGKDGATNGNLKIVNVATGFRGTLQRFGLITSDIGATEGARIAKDMYSRYAFVY